MLELFASGSTHSEIFPVGKPFKSLYAVHSLRQYIAQSPKVGLLNPLPGFGINICRGPPTK